MLEGFFNAFNRGMVGTYPALRRTTLAAPEWEVGQRHAGDQGGDLGVKRQIAL